MKNFIVLGFVLLSFIAKAQEIQKVSVEKNLNSVQLGLYSLSYQNESRLERKITLRSEIGLATGNSTVNHPDGTKETSFLVVPFLNVEPRWYYGLDRRSRLNKNTKNNSSNYFSLLTSFVSSRTTLVNTKDFEAAPFISIIPEFGIRRTSANKHFYSESSVGFGYKHNFFDNSYSYAYCENQTILDIQFKFGYIF
jgi:hypothetical protein